MKKKNLVLICILFSYFTINSFSQNEKCGTTENLKVLLFKNPSYQTIIDSIELKNNEWTKKSKQAFKSLEISKNSLPNKNSQVQSINTICNYDNVYFTAINAPSVQNQIVSPTPNCTYGGEFVRINNLIAGNTYRISTIGLNTFDTTLTVYTEGGISSVAYNDDWDNSIQSEIYFTPFVSGNYDILIDQFGCQSNQLCASLEIELWDIPRPIISIPVVVHVIHNGEPIGIGANISDAQIISQIDALNEDFRRLNTNLANTPSAFKGTSADALIQFCLAQQKPDGSPTSGIDRFEKPTQQEYISLNIPPELRCLNMLTLETIIKPYTIWDRDKYLNIWVSDLRKLPIDGGCTFQASTLGYAQFPGLGGPYAPTIPGNLTDGIWIRTDVFGTIGNLTTPYNLGKTTTHEVGHWLNLKHTWGDEPLCNDDDNVIDTPIQSVDSSGCSNFPLLDSCSNIYPGIMFVNFMDYSNDNCLSIFTYGQVARMEASLLTQRNSLLTSPGCQPSILNNNGFTNNNSLKVFPNPFVNSINIESNDNIMLVEVFNLLGQKVEEINNISFGTKSIVIDLSRLFNEGYILKINTENSLKTIKIVKK